MVAVSLKVWANGSFVPFQPSDNYLCGCASLERAGEGWKPVKEVGRNDMKGLFPLLTILELVKGSWS